MVAGAQPRVPACPGSGRLRSPFTRHGTSTPRSAALCAHACRHLARFAESDCSPRKRATGPLTARCRVEELRPPTFARISRRPIELAFAATVLHVVRRVRIALRRALSKHRVRCGSERSTGWVVEATPLPPFRHVSEGLDLFQRAVQTRRPAARRPGDGTRRAPARRSLVAPPRCLRPPLDCPGSRTSPDLRWLVRGPRQPSETARCAGLQGRLYMELVASDLAHGAGSGPSSRRAA